MTITLLELCTRLLELDEDKKCPFCPKDEWGPEKHDSNCPFAMAYSVIDSPDIDSLDPEHPERYEALDTKRTKNEHNQ